MLCPCCPVLPNWLNSLPLFADGGAVRPVSAAVRARPRTGELARCRASRFGPAVPIQSTPKIQYAKRSIAAASCIIQLIYLKLLAYKDASRRSGSRARSNLIAIFNQLTRDTADADTTAAADIVLV